MLEFLSLVFFRMLSGIQNALGYAKKNGWRIAATIAIVGFCFTTAGLIAFSSIPIIWKILAVTAAGIGIAGALGVEDSFNQEMDFFPLDVHLWESVLTAAITIAFAFAGANILMIIASVYPGLILHKGAVNVGGGLPFWDTRTDDATGRTFRIPLLGIAVVRGGNAWRIMLTSFSLALAACTYAFKWQVTVTPLVIDLFGR